MNSYSFLILVGLVLSFNWQAVAQNALTSNGATITITSGSTLHVNGDSHFHAGGTFSNNSSFSTTGRLTTDPTMTAAALGTLTFNGTSVQTIDGEGTYLANNVIVDNPSGIQLGSSFQVDGTLTLTRGIINATSNPLLLTANATVSGASDQSHINGYVQKQGTGSFNYPVGNGSKLQSVSVNLTENSDGFQARYFAGDAGTASFVTTGASTKPLLSYNSQEYWNLSPIGTAVGTVTLFWDETNNASITPSDKLGVFHVAHKTSSGWANEGSAQVTGTISSGSVTSKSISTWSPFTLGAISETGLPVTLVEFRAQPSENHVLITWTTTQEANTSHFEIEKSEDGTHYKVIEKVEAAGNSTSLKNYSYLDTTFPSPDGILYYRLRSVDENGSFSYSKAVSIQTPEQTYVSSVYPNPVRRSERLLVESNTTVKQVKVYNILGIASSVTTRQLSTGKIEINTSSLHNGVYLIRVDTAHETSYHRLIVN